MWYYLSVRQSSLAYPCDKEAKLKASSFEECRNARLWPKNQFYFSSLSTEHVDKAKMKLLVSTIFIASFILPRFSSNPIDLSPNFLLGSLRNVTSSATSFISDSIQKQTDIILHVKDTATNYVTNAMAVPKTVLNNVKNATKNYIDSTTSIGMEIKIRSLMELLRTQMPYGIPALDLPVLEPLTIEHKDLEINHQEIGNISCALDNVSISQLSTFIIDNVKISVIDGVSLAMNLSVPSIRANGMYRVSGKIGTLFAVDGGGLFDLEIHGSRFYFHTDLGYSGSMYVKKLDIDFSIQSIDADFQGLFPDQKVTATMNKVIADLAPEILEVVKPELRPEIEEMLIHRVNASVSRLTIGNIISILTGTADIRSFANLRSPHLP